MNQVSVFSWNVNGVRSRVIPSLETLVKSVHVDFVCLQETKLTAESFGSIKLDGYHPHFSISKSTQKARQAYSGVEIFVKDNLESDIISIESNFLNESHVDEGRFLAIEFKNFIIATVYVPNSGTNLVFRRDVWHPAIKQWVTSKNKKLILTGDFNSITTPHDVWWAEPGQSRDGTPISEKIFHDRVMKERQDTPGVMPYEIEALQDLKDSAGLFDIWKLSNPGKVYSGFTWFNARTRGARESNKGWRIDYIFTNFKPEDPKCVVLDSESSSSDHAPLLARFRLI